MRKKICPCKFSVNDRQSTEYNYWPTPKIEGEIGTCVISDLSQLLYSVRKPTSPKSSLYCGAGREENIKRPVGEFIKIWDYYLVASEDVPTSLPVALPRFIKRTPAADRRSDVG